jgi:hypothetical protein
MFTAVQSSEISSGEPDPAVAESIDTVAATEADAPEGATSTPGGTDRQLRHPWT